jgi:hypothetical protein
MVSASADAPGATSCHWDHASLPGRTSDGPDKSGLGYVANGGISFAVGRRRTGKKRALRLNVERTTHGLPCGAQPSANEALGHMLWLRT